MKRGAFQSNAALSDQTRALFNQKTGTFQSNTGTVRSNTDASRSTRCGARVPVAAPGSVADTNVSALLHFPRQARAARHGLRTQGRGAAG